MCKFCGKVYWASLALLHYFELEALQYLPLTWTSRWLMLCARLQFRLSSHGRQYAVERMKRFYPLAPNKCLMNRAEEYYSRSFVNRRLKRLIMTYNVKPYLSRFRVDGWEWLETAMAQGKGVVLLGSHVGMPQLLRWYLSNQGHSIHYLVLFGKRNKPRGFYQKLYWWIDYRFRQRAERLNLGDNKLMGNEAFSLKGLKKSYDHLRNNGIVFIIGDAMSGDRRLPVQVIDREVKVGLGGLSLALSSGAVILPIFSDFKCQSNSEFHIQIQKPLSYDQTVPKSEQLETLAKDYAARLEAYIMADPTTFTFIRGFGHR